MSIQWLNMIAGQKISCITGAVTNVYKSAIRCIIDVLYSGLLTLQVMWHC